MEASPSGSLLASQGGQITGRLRQKRQRCSTAHGLGQTAQSALELSLLDLERLRALAAVAQERDAELEQL